MKRNAFVILGGFLTIQAAGAQPTPEQVKFFETSIRPLFAEHCFGCHSAKSKINHGGLRLDSRSALFQGGHSGQAVVPGKPDESRLVEVLRYASELKMPPQGKLKQEQIDAVVAWVTMGAPWPEKAEAAPPATAAAKTEDQKKRREHWAWKSPVKATPPDTRNKEWASGDIDRFILAALEAKGLQPSPDADRRTLLRRVYFDLTGLPPKPEEVDAFAADTSADAYERVVDRLLASPRFGERWGRHWLDLTYYADNLEIGRRIPATEAWRYRDYVISAFNSDKHYDKFVTEQLAGDLLPAENDAQRREQLVATGLLVLGPWPLVAADKEQLKMDVVDLQLDLIGKAFLGLTLGCARCHDHKFDPVSARDYYAMAGILASTQTLNGRIDGIFSDVNKTPLPETAAELRQRAEKLETYHAKLVELQQRRKKLAEEKERIEKAQPPAHNNAGPDAVSTEVKAATKELQKVTDEIALLEFNRPEPPYAFSARDVEAPADGRINVRGNAHALGDTIPRSFIQIAMWEGPPALSYRASGRLELAKWVANEKNPLTAKVAVNRFWQHLFGAGLVRSVDNFGLRGELPSHPQLLDFLATRFVEQGWSMKKAIREMVLSRTYRQSAGHNAKGNDADPENRLLWRMNRRRLEGEVIRDAVLSIAGALDLTPGGPSLPLDIPGNVGLGKPPEFRDDAKLPPELLLRRTVYLPVLRKSQLHSLDILNLFDFPDVNQVNGARSVTTIPTQALYLMNAPFLHEQSGVLAKQALDAAADNPARVTWLIRRVLGRAVRPDDQSRAGEFVTSFAADLRKQGKTQQEAEQEAWTRYCHALLVSNEFLYLQ